MKKLLVILLIGALLLNGCTMVQEESASVDSVVEKDADNNGENEQQAKPQSEKTPTDEEQAQEQPSATEETTVPEAPAAKEPPETPATPAIHKFWETEEEMPYKEAVAIVKEKLENRFNETLTDKERMAYYQCISATVYAEYLFYHESYAKYSKDMLSNPKLSYADPESPNYRTDNPWIQLECVTTEEGVGLNFQNETPLSFEEGYTIFDLFIPDTVKETNQSISIYTCYLNKEDGTFLGRDSRTVISRKLDHGTGFATRYFNFENVNILKEKLSKETIQEIVRYYLSFESVTWVNIYFEDGFINAVYD